MVWYIKEIYFLGRVGRTGSSRRTVKVEQLFEDREEYCQCSSQSFQSRCFGVFIFMVSILGLK
jgi:hypothetical protein